MDDILNGMRNMSSHCETEEYDNLLEMIQLSKNVKGFETAKKINILNKRYMNGIAFNLDDYINKVTEENCRFIETIKRMFDEYVNMVEHEPYNYDAQISLSLQIYEKMRDGLDVGMAMVKKKNIV